MAYFHGPWFVTPAEIPSQLGRSYYKAEAFLSSISDSNPLLSVVGKCVVLDLPEYCSQRPTQHQESDVYCCESYFDEGKRVIMPLPSSLKKYQHGLKVKKDEVYFFKRPIIPPQKVALSAPIPIPDPGGSEDDAEPPNKRPKPGAVEGSDDEPEAEYECPGPTCPFTTPIWETFRR